MELTCWRRCDTSGWFAGRRRRDNLWLCGRHCAVLLRTVLLRSLLRCVLLLLLLLGICLWRLGLWLLRLLRREDWICMCALQWRGTVMSLCMCILTSGILIHNTGCVRMMGCLPPPRPGSVRPCRDIVGVVKRARQWDGCIWVTV